MNFVFISAQGDGVEEVTSSVEEACLTDVCTGIRLQWLLNKQQNNVPRMQCDYMELLSILSKLFTTIYSSWQWMQHYFSICSVLSMIWLFSLFTADPNEPSDDGEVASARDYCLSSMTAEEMVICFTMTFPI